jgi:putative phosphoesterase
MKLVSKQVEVPVRENGQLRLVIVADTHSEPHPKSADLIAKQKPDAILHAGDIGSLDVVAGLAKIAPTHVVRGNIDVHADELPDVLTLDVGGLFRMLLIHIAVYGPKIRAEVAKRAKADDCAIVVCGHSHIPFIGKDKGLTVFNPGSIGPRRFHLPIVFGVLDLKDGRVALKHVSCETGEQWLP